MKKYLLSAALLLASCNGPWNMMADDYGAPSPRLWVSSFAVADRPFDTLWVERPQSLTESYDSTRAFVDTAATTIRVVREDLPDTIVFHPIPGSAVAWLPAKNTPVARGATYRLEAVVVWNTASNWASGGSTPRRDSLVARTTVPRVYELVDYALAPIEAIAPWAGEVAKVSEAPADRRAILEDLSATDATLDSVRANLPVYRPIRDGDSVWYLHDETKVTDITGANVARYYRNYLFAQKMDKSAWEGVLSVQGFDTTAQYILSPLSKEFLRSSGSTKIDSNELYQKGSLRTLGLEEPTTFGQDIPASVGELADTLAKFYGTDIRPWFLTNVYLGYTGRNVIRLYALDQNHYEYMSRLRNAGSSNALRWSNVANGDGYFSSAAVDSFQIFVRADRDTFSVQALHATWCRKQKESAAKDGKPWNPGTICAGF